MDVEGWRFVMDVGIATVVAVLLGSVLSFIFNAWNDNRGWKKVKSKIGEKKSFSLEEQHDNIEKVIVDKTENIKEFQDREFSKIYIKVDKIDEITAKNEGLYQNLNVDQKEVRNNVNKLVLDWEKTISENKDLKSQIEVYKSEKKELKIDNEKIKEMLNKIISNNEKVMEQNANLKAESKAITEQLLDMKKDKDKNNDRTLDDEWEHEL